MKARKDSRIIDADELLKASGFKMPSKEVLAMQAELLEGEQIARNRNLLPKMPDPLEMERSGNLLREKALQVVR